MEVDSQVSALSAPGAAFATQIRSLFEIPMWQENWLVTRVGTQWNL